MRSLRVVLWMPKGAEIPGGHVVQLQRTAQGLADLGCEVVESYDSVLPAMEADIVHGFGLGSEQITSCRSRGIPVAISTIYWPQAYRVKGPEGEASFRDLAGRLNRALRYSVASLRGHESLIRLGMTELHHEVQVVAELSAADVLLPNAEGEARDLRRDLGITTPCAVVPNGADASWFTPGDTPFAERRGVLYVARAEPRKNQLGFLAALRECSLPVTISCFAHRDHGAYLEQCRAAAAGWATVVEEPSPAQLVGLYRAARVHVLPSWFETTGLVSLEAALCGCNVVTTDRGYAAEYFGDLAWYCDPARPETIRSAVEAAHDSPLRSALRERVLRSYTWSHVAEATLAAYRMVLTARGT